MNKKTIKKYKNLLLVIINILALMVIMVLIGLIKEVLTIIGWGSFL